jgi:HJR/Mrr/RecB family endonuclease
MYYTSLKNIVNAIFTPQIWALLLILLIITGCTVFYILKLKPIKRSIVIPEIDSTNIVELVEYLKTFFKKSGYIVNKAEYAGNEGSAMLIVQRGQIKTFVLAVVHKRNVNVKQVRKVASAMKDRECDNAIIVANLSFSENAESLQSTLLVYLLAVKICDRYIAEKY